MDAKDTMARTLLALERSEHRLQNSTRCLHVTQDRVAVTERDIKATWEALKRARAWAWISKYVPN
jgi:hypothetical protein